ncbi:hypothetical protein FLAVO9R_30470 [Flavobacterium sp. 9R]|nr:hypothetical protein FLAVO9R_30470 [Flavobacterium sp. 9R]
MKSRKIDLYNQTLLLTLKFNGMIQKMKNLFKIRILLFGFSLLILVVLEIIPLMLN